MPASASKQTSRRYDASTARRPHPGPIIVATDGETTSATLFGTARRLAERTGARVEVLAVLEPIPSPAVGLGIEPPPPPLFVEESRKTIVLANARRLVAEAGGGWPVELAYGSPKRVIAEAARERRASILLMEKHQHSPLGRLFDTDTVLATLRHAGTPVLSVPPGFDVLPARAVVAVDFSAASVRAARAALALLRAPATLTLVHVTPQLVAEQRLRALYDEAYAARVATYFERLTTDLAAPPGVAVRTVNLKGDTVSRQLLSFAKQVAADLIACGARSHGPIARLFVGTVASALVREAPDGCAVLVAPPPSAAEALVVEGRLSGAAGSTDPAAWAAILDEITRRSGRRRAQMEVDDPSFGAVAQASGVAFFGATYDHNDRRIELMFGEPDGEGPRHLTRTIEDATSVDVLVDPEGRDVVLRIGHGRGQTLVIFDPPTTSTPAAAPAATTGEK